MTVKANRFSLSQSAVNRGKRKVKRLCVFQMEAPECSPAASFSILNSDSIPGVLISIRGFHPRTDGMVCVRASVRASVLTDGGCL